MTIDDLEYEPILEDCSPLSQSVVRFLNMHVLRFEFMAEFYKLSVKFGDKFEL